VLRPLFPLALLACAGGLAACGGQADPSRHRATSAAPAGPCASASDFTRLRAGDGARAFRVTGRITCVDGWAAAYLKQSQGLTDPVWTVLRRRGGRWHLVTYGTDGLCDARGMGSAPAAIRKALGPYC
jgi:hypothetical protein